MLLKIVCKIFAHFLSYFRDLASDAYDIII
jgi:hypothetical protein